MLHTGLGDFHQKGGHRVQAQHLAKLLAWLLKDPGERAVGRHRLFCQGSRIGLFRTKGNQAFEAFNLAEVVGITATEHRKIARQKRPEVKSVMPCHRKMSRMLSAQELKTTVAGHEHVVIIIVSGLLPAFIR